MSNVNEIRQALLKQAGPIVEHLIAEATGGDSPLHKGRIDQKSLDRVWKMLEPMILAAEDAVKLPALSDGKIDDKVTVVYEAVASGQLTIDQGKRLTEMLQAGFEITELQELIGKLEESGVSLD